MTAKIKLNAASGGGSVSIQAPSSSSNTRVITLPDIADGTLVTSQSTLDATKLSGALPAISGANLTGVSSDFVKLSNVASTTSVDSIVFQSLDTATYKAFRLVFAALPATDNVHLIFRFMSGSNLASAGNYSWAFMGVSGGSSHFEDHGVGNSNARIHNNGGNADYEGWRTVIDIVFQTTNDFTAANNYATWIGNRVDGSGNYRWESGTLYYENDLDTNGFNLAPENGQFNKYSYTLYGLKR